MILIEKYVLDSCQIVENNKVLAVRSRKQKWVVSESGELLIDNNAGFHRVTIFPGDWASADTWGVRQYADIVWTQSVIDEWAASIQQTIERNNMMVSGSVA